jgi:hypothetical protein
VGLALWLPFVGLAASVASVTLGGGGCSRETGGTGSPFTELDAVLRPQRQVTAMRRLPSSHYVATSTFRVSAPPPPESVAAQSEHAPRDTITSNTELWLDRRGQYRLVESNDQDGGRTVVKYGHDLAVALRYGKSIRRPAQEPEPTRILEEAVGGPWAAWETVRRFAKVSRGSAPGLYRLTYSPRPAALASAQGDPTPLRRWRDTVQVQALEGEVKLAPTTNVLLGFSLKARFTATRDDRVPLSGEVAVTSRLDGIGRTASILPPAAEPLDSRQRTILEEKALLGDLARPLDGEPLPR